MLIGNPFAGSVLKKAKGFKKRSVNRLLQHSNSYCHGLAPQVCKL